MNYKLLSIICLTFIISLTACSSSQNENSEQVELTISAAASLTEVLSEIEQVYEEENKQVNLLFNFGGSGSLQQQIIQGAPVDLFFSAAEDKFDQLAEQGLVDHRHKVDLIGNKLTLIIPKESTAEMNDFTDLQSEEIKHLGIGVPENVPAGYYGKQVLQNLKIWDNVESKLIPTKDVRQVLSYVETNNVDAGIVYYTDAILSNKIKIISNADSSLHDPIIYPVGIINDSPHKEVAIDFFEFLTTEKANVLFEKYGFEIVGR